MGLRSQDKAINRSGFLAKQVTNPSTKAPTYVLAINSSGKIVGSQTVSSDRVAGFALPLADTYEIVAFADLNKNKQLDQGEPTALATGQTAAGLANTEITRKLGQLTLSTPTPAKVVGLTVPATGGDAVTLAVGEIAQVKDARFNTQTGENGLWKPETSLRAGNIGLFFTEPYDPNRIPVVFVHGIGGSPQDFIKLIPALDHSRYQAWFFAYPSGFRLEKAASALAGFIKIAAQKYGIPRVYIVAHSMGGLVSRAAIVDYFQDTKVTVDRFVSISTPWNGHSAASWGIRGLKYPVPSWIDMAPGSTFLKNLWSHKLPPSTRHWLIFGYDTRRLPWLTLNNDQVIDLQSSLYIPAQEESVRVFGLRRSHEGILSSHETAVKMNEYLSE